MFPPAARGARPAALVRRKVQHPIAHCGKCPSDAASGRSSSPSERNGAYSLGKPSWHRHAFSDRKTRNCHCKHRSGYGEFSLERLSGRSYRKFEASLECLSIRWPEDFLDTFRRSPQLRAIACCRWKLSYSGYAYIQSTRASYAATKAPLPPPAKVKNTVLSP